MTAAGQTAVIDGDTVFNYGELARRVAGLGGGLRSIGVETGEVVGVLALNSHRHLEYWLGVPAIGAVLNDLNYRLGEDELAFIIDGCSTVCSSPRSIPTRSDGPSRSTASPSRFWCLP